MEATPYIYEFGRVRGHPSERSLAALGMTAYLWVEKWGVMRRVAHPCTQRRWPLA